jgi:hypothetical protein
MNLDDITLLGKKVFVGIVVTAVPAGILLGGLSATQHFLQTRADAPGTHSMPQRK